jgi:hypothetical protein
MLANIKKIYEKMQYYGGKQKKNQNIFLKIMNILLKLEILFGYMYLRIKDLS